VFTTLKCHGTLSAARIAAIQAQGERYDKKGRAALPLGCGHKARTANLDQRGK